MKVLVTGGRNYKNYAEVCRTLGQLYNQYGITLLIHGGADGADKLCDMWAKGVGVHTCRVDALWHHYDLAAGFKRNSVMLLLQPDLVVAFPGGSGTASMVQLAEKANLPIEKVL
ncbi:MAG: hypothetical protein Unbinned8596contig1000_36 [Prokaryotic dsDNA virus sp.]|nr:MAG: hypothetical protein Unbinned8596contig1000_36 [Prokaryotic dsDNA virus sp.]|tara:strand:+ start:579 stop:920 length:342 start_codon:yes stop_codon:yes gene_type:complete